MIPTGEWHYIAAAYDGQTWKLYLDGALDTTLTLSSPFTPEFTSIQHAAVASALQSSGLPNGSTSGYFSGEIDEARVWNYARSASEIASSWRNEIANASGLVGRWGMDEGSGNIIADSSGSGVTGTLMNSPAWTAGGFIAPPPDTTAPAAPTGLSATAGDQQVSLNWDDNSELDVAGYNIYRGTSSGSYDLAPINGGSLVTESSYNDTGLTNGTEYFYVVTAVDTSDNESVVSLEDSATPAGLPPSAVSFDGTNDYITFGAAPGLGATNFTLEAWIYWTGGGVSMSTSTTQGLPHVIPIVSKGRGEADGSNLDTNYFLGIDTDTHALAIDFEDMASGMNYPFVGTTPVSTNTWHHVAGTYDSVNGIYTLYLDGEIAGTEDIADNTIPRYDSIQHAGIATAMTSTGLTAGFFQGVIDEVRIWNVVRSQAEIQASKNSEINSASGLIGRWGMNEGSGTTIYDSSGVSNANGTLTNGPTWYAGGFVPPIPDTTPPDAPTGLVATPGFEIVNLDWDDNSESDLVGYNVYRGTVSGVYNPTPLNGGTLLVNSAYSDSSVTNGTEYFYTVTAVDTSENESDFSNEDSATPSGGLDASIDFGGANAYVDFGNPAKLHLEEFTIECWFRKDGNGMTTTTGTHGIPNALPLVTRGRGQDETTLHDTNFFMGIDADTSALAADFEEGASGASPSENHPVIGATVITNGVWHHAAATYDGTTWKLYLDGKLDGELLVGQPVAAAGEQYAAIGSALTTTGVADGFFDGAIDEVRIWDHALSQSDLVSNINSELTSGTGLMARWGINENGGTSINDSLADPANGVITGANYLWAAGSPFNLDLAPNQPTLVSPSNGTIDESTSTTLTVNVTHPWSDDLSVSFYGKPKNSTGEDFSLIVIPDPQYYAASYPDIYYAQMDWVVEHALEDKIPYVISLGDNVDDINQPSQWTVATTAFDILGVAGMPYGLVLGNHDGAPSNTANFNTNFGSRIAAQPTYGGRPDGATNYDNTYALFSASGMDFIVIYIEYDDGMTSPTNAVLQWANDLLQAYPDRRAIIATHNLLSGNSFTAQGQAIYDALKRTPTCS